jgi:ParB-like chromosome segregation protein Spo0J
MKTEQVNISEVKPNPNNPRIIKDDKFAKLVQSIKDFPKMLEIRPIVVNSDMIVLGGNMRLKACKEAGLKKVHIIKADDLTEEQQREFIVKDNVSGGEWDWNMLANEWDAEDLDKWGLDVPTFDNKDYSDKNQELNVDDFENQNYTIKLEFTEDDYNFVKDKLQQLGQTPEKILYDALVSL